MEERRVAHEESVAEAERQDSLRAERQQLYLEYLGVIDQWSRILQRDFSRERWLQWWDQYNEVDNRVELLGSEAVRTATYTVFSAIHEMRKDADFEAEDLDKEGWRLSEQHGDAISEARQEILHAMRADLRSPA